MKQILLNTKISKIYMICVILIAFLLLTSYFSYAMFTVSKEKSNAISIVTGTLSYVLKIDGVSTDKLVVGPKEEKTFTITLSNPNERMARFNFYYLNNLPSGVFAGYKIIDNYNTPPIDTGVNLEKVNTISSSQTYQIVLANHTEEEQIINLGVSVGLDYNNLSLPSNGHLFREITNTVSDTILFDTKNNINVEDNEQYFVTGEDPNNYIWYSGKLWRAVSIDTSDNSVKLVTQWNISAISYNESGNTAFEGSYMEEWLNDISVDGFLGNLREPEKFIKMNSVWNATETAETTKLAKTTLVTDPVGLLNSYEHTMSYSGTDYTTGYLNNGLGWWSITPYNDTQVCVVFSDGSISYDLPTEVVGIRPTINLKPSIKIVKGNGTENNPYRIDGDNDTNLLGTLLNTRYSGEYIRFGTGENNLYRIVSHENVMGTKITSAEPLKKSGNFITTTFGNNSIFTNNNTIGMFLNRDYLNIENGYLKSEDIAMIEESSTWYLGVVGDSDSYKLAKYTNTTDNIFTTSIIYTKVGLLRLGELMAGQFTRYSEKGENIPTNLTTMYWTLTPYNNTNYVHRIRNSGSSIPTDTTQVAISIKPSLNLKQNVIITGGDGTLQNPFTLAFAS